MRINTFRAFIAAALVLASCATSPPVTKGGHKFAAAQTISASYDPSVSGLPGNVGDIVSVAGGATAWVKSGTSVTSWVAFPGGIGGGQDPSAVAITGGTIVGINTATRSVQGAMAPADKAFLDDVDGWRKTQYATMIAAVPNLTAFREIQLGVDSMATAVSGTITAPTLDANAEGGGITANATKVRLGDSIFQNLPGGNYAFACRAKIASVGTGGNIGYCGLGWLVGVHTATMFIGAYNSQDSSHYILFFATDAALTKVVLTTTFGANAWHDFVVSDDGTTVKAWVDGVLAGSTATRTNIPIAAPMYPMFESSATSEIVVSRFAYGYVQP